MVHSRARPVRFAIVVLALQVSGPLGGRVLWAVQNSIYGMQGIGFPGRPLSIKARALGGGNAIFDPASAFNPAALAGYTRLAASFGLGTTFRTFTAGDTSVGWLKETRLPLGMVGAPIGTTGLKIGVSFAPYAERSFDVRSRHATVIRGESVTVDDRIAAEGGITDFRAALGYSLRPWLLVGAAVHVLSGSSRVRVRRDFSNPEYRPFVQQSDVTFASTGVSAGVVASLGRGIQLGAVARSDGVLRSEFPLSPPERVDLPVSLAGGLRLVPTGSLTWTASAVWRSWSDASGGLMAGTRAFDTWDLSSGLELGGGEGVLGLPLVLRLGARHATLPFSARETQPKEFTLSAGSGFFLAGGRVALDLSVERALRSGAGAREQAWHVAGGITVVP